MLVLNSVTFFTVLLQLTFSENINPNCESKQKCSECIQELGCIWCINSTRKNHCVNETEKNWCEDRLIVNPKNKFEILENRDLTSGEEVVQIKPQRVKLQLRKGEEFELPFQYAQAENYPVDLYYIMDMSFSMQPFRDKLSELGNEIARTMRNITTDFRLGFGSFVDKVDLPFVDIFPENLEHPCVNTSYNCVRAYSFKHHMSLNANDSLFSKEVSKANVSGNLDPPEGGLDALMQAIVCRDLIGWRSQTRRLIVFCTDAEFHIAGDGKLAGVVEPNDAQCHMKNNLYTHDLKLDYPSVHQINYVAKQNNINIVFAIVNNDDALTHYKAMSKVIENSNVGNLSNDSDNFVKLALDNYNKIANTVTISSNSSRQIEVKISSKCGNPIPNGCSNIHVGDIVNFTATIKALGCTNETIIIKPGGIDESIVVDLEVLCNCDCDYPPSEFFVPKSPECSKNGTLKCGVCDCDSGFFGENCECSKETSDNNDVSNCKPDENATLCSGLGICRCGQCKCNERQNPYEKITGTYCECDNYSCKRVKGKLCSGHGTCECNGVCRCHPEWIGVACECPATNNTCIKPDNKKLMCNNHGSCECGKCECFDEEVRYSGKYCDECPTCGGQRCEELRLCVECLVFNTGLTKEECQHNCSKITYNVVDELNSGDSDAKTCTLVDDNDCTFIFNYQTQDDKYFVLTVQREKMCRTPPNVFLWVLGVIGAILLPAIVSLILWKVLTTVHDRREYARFENDRINSRWHASGNPLFKAATTTFVNPLYSASKIFSRKNN